MTTKTGKDVLDLIAKEGVRFVELPLRRAPQGRRQQRRDCVPARNAD